MGARILFRDSQGRDGEVHLDANTPIFVGRALECVIRTDDAMVSRKHSTVRMEGGRFVVEDLGSSNGTHVNDQRVTKQALNHNDVVRCGSMWLRYIEDSPLAEAQPAAQTAQPAPSMPKRGGTQRLDVSGGVQQAQPAAPQYAQPVPVQPSQPAQPYGQPPAMNPQPSYGNVANAQAQQPAHSPQPYSQPPSMPGAPAMPASVPVPAGPPSIPPPDAGVMGGAQVQAAGGLVESSIVVDMGDPVEVTKLRAEVEQARIDLDTLQASYDREVADGKRMRAESSTLRDRIDEQRRSISDRDEQVAAHARVAEELRDELKQLKDDLASSRLDLSEMVENVHSRERQLGRSQEDVAKLKQEIDDLKRQLSEISKTKDEGWKKLNEQLSEIEHLREVINEQERMLEERRVGLVSQEEALKELRADKERRIKEIAQVKAERDELAANDGRTQAQLRAIDEENRRLSGMLVQAQSGSPGADGEHTLQLAGDIKELRVEVRKLESDLERTSAASARADEQIDRLERENAALEVDLREAREGADKAKGAKGVAEQAVAKAEVARHKAAEEAIAAAQARDAALTGTDDLKRDLDRALRRIKELESSSDGSGDVGEELAAKVTKLELELSLARDKVIQAERSLKTKGTELDAALADAKHARAEAEAAALLGAGGGRAGDSGPGGDAISEKATEVYEGINDVLSELRNNIVMVQGEFADFSKEDSGDSVRMITETLEALLGSAEDAKGVLRGLRELVEFG